MGSIINHAESMLDILQTAGFAPFKEEYQLAWLHTNQKVYFTVSWQRTMNCSCGSQRAQCASCSQVVLEEKGPGGEPISVNLKIIGISDNAYMMAVDERGEACELHPDGNRWGTGHLIISQQ